MNKDFQGPYNIIPAVALNMAASITSTVLNTRTFDNCGITVKWTSANAVGVITIEVSNNYNPHLGTGDWYALTFNPALTQPASNNGGYAISLNQLPFLYYRVVYTRGSGTGMFEAWASGKQV